jgi:galactofuranose transport system permease protein
VSKLAERPWAPTAVALALLLAFGALRYEAFFAPAVLVDLLDDAAVLGFAALGASLVIAGGGIDLSVGAVMALASVIVARASGDVPAPVAIVAALGVGLALGACVGTLIDALALPAFIVTLGVMFLARGAALAIHVESLPIASESWTRLARVELPLGPAGALDLAAIAWLAAAAVVGWGLRHARTLRDALALGGDERTALYFGVRVRRTRVAVYALAGAFSALAGVAYALYSSKGDSTAGVGLELDAIAAAVIGGASLRGGTASALGVVLGALVLGTLQTMLVFEGVPGAGWTRVALGALLLAFLCAQRAVPRPVRG